MKTKVMKTKKDERDKDPFLLFSNAQVNPIEDLNLDVSTFDLTGRMSPLWKTPPFIPENIDDIDILAEIENDLRQEGLQDIKEESLQDEPETIWTPIRVDAMSNKEEPDDTVMMLSVPPSTVSPPYAPSMVSLPVAKGSGRGRKGRKSTSKVTLGTGTITKTQKPKPMYNKTQAECKDAKEWEKVKRAKNTKNYHDSIKNKLEVANYLLDCTLSRKVMRDEFIKMNTMGGEEIQVLRQYFPGLFDKWFSHNF